MIPFIKILSSAHEMGESPQNMVLYLRVSAKVAVLASWLTGTDFYLLKCESIGRVALRQLLGMDVTLST